MRKTFISKKCLKHSDLGIFKKDNGKFVMFKGGHGQSNILFLKKHKIKFKINAVYKNGVRIGNVLDHKRHGYKFKNKQCWFPKDWSTKTIKIAGNKILKEKENQKRIDHKRLTAVYKGVSVGMYTQKGFAQTIFPLRNQKVGLLYDNRGIK